jgi:hypothetical protein
MMGSLGSSNASMRLRKLPRLNATTGVRINLAPSNLTAFNAEVLFNGTEFLATATFTTTGLLRTHRKEQSPGRQPRGSSRGPRHITENPHQRPAVESCRGGGAVMTAGPKRFGV